MSSAEILKVIASYLGIYKKKKFNRRKQGKKKYLSVRTLFQRTVFSKSKKKYFIFLCKKLTNEIY